MSDRDAQEPAQPAAGATNGAPGDPQADWATNAQQEPNLAGRALIDLDQQLQQARATIVGLEQQRDTYLKQRVQAEGVIAALRADLEAARREREVCVREWQAEMERRHDQVIAAEARVREVEAENARLREVLGRLEWDQGRYGTPCPACEQDEQDGHADGCWLAAVLYPPTAPAPTTAPAPSTTEVGRG